MKKKNNRVDDAFDSRQLTGYGNDLIDEENGHKRKQKNQKPPKGCLVSIFTVFFIIVIFSLIMFLGN